MTCDEFINLVPPPSHDDIKILANKLWKQGGELKDASDYYWHRAQVILWTAYIHKLDHAVGKSEIINGRYFTGGL